MKQNKEENKNITQILFKTLIIITMMNDYILTMYYRLDKSMDMIKSSLPIINLDIKKISKQLHKLKPPNILYNFSLSFNLAYSQKFSTLFFIWVSLTTVQFILFSVSINGYLFKRAFLYQIYSLIALFLCIQTISCLYCSSICLIFCFQTIQFNISYALSCTIFLFFYSLRSILPSSRTTSIFIFLIFCSLQICPFFHCSRQSQQNQYLQTQLICMQPSLFSIIYLHVGHLPNRRLSYIILYAKYQHYPLCRGHKHLEQYFFEHLLHFSKFLFRSFQLDPKIPKSQSSLWQCFTPLFWHCLTNYIFLYFFRHFYPNICAICSFYLKLAEHPPIHFIKQNVLMDYCMYDSVQLLQNWCSQLVIEIILLSSNLSKQVKHSIFFDFSQNLSDSSSYIK